MKAALELSQKYVLDEEVLINYMELLEGYFTSKLPVKVYDGLSLKVRFYGSLTTHQKEE